MIGPTSPATNGFVEHRDTRTQLGYRDRVKAASMLRLMQNDAVTDAEGPVMRTTITIDDELFAQALALSEPAIERSELLRECVKAYVRQQTARRLAALGGQVPDMVLVPRRGVEATPDAERLGP